jgi:16S rRNA (adenine1518-N6/adenine1519-N6)-dimethyltransferase
VQSTSDVPRLLRRHGIRPLKRLGQHFLTDPQAIQSVVEAAELSGEETVLEVGAGLGSLTLALLERAARVIAVEYDPRLLPVLREALPGSPRVQIVAEDILALDLRAAVGTGPYLVVANIPYNITSALIRRFLETEAAPQRMVLTIQREVAERVVAGPGQMSLLALSVRVYGTPRLAARIPAAAFYPRPKVDSAVLRVDLHPRWAVRRELLEPMFELARTGFEQRRKMLKNTLGQALRLSPAGIAEILTEAGLSAEARPQELAVADWVRLTETALARGN